MKSQIAKGFYTGTAGRKMNCAQAVTAAFLDKYTGEDDVSRHQANGGGRAPEGVCGAWHAAEEILKTHAPDKIAELKAAFAGHAGGLGCADIRASRKLSCVGCVETCAKMVDEA